MMQTCKKVLRCVRKNYKNGYPSFYEISSKLNMHPLDVDSACKVLVEEGYVAYHYQIANGKATTIPGGIYLTLKGRKPTEFFFDQLRDYLKKNWIAITALIISIVSLLQSWGLISIPLPGL